MSILYAHNFLIHILKLKVELFFLLLFHRLEGQVSLVKEGERERERGGFNRCG